MCSAGSMTSMSWSTHYAALGAGDVPFFLPLTFIVTVRI